MITGVVLKPFRYMALICCFISKQLQTEFKARVGNRVTFKTNCEKNSKIL